jgi:hypothetical protein
MSLAIAICAVEGEIYRLYSDGAADDTDAVVRLMRCRNVLRGMWGICV